MNKTRILLADDRELARADVHSLLEKILSVQIVGGVNDGSRVLAMLKKYRPDVVLMDISMPRLKGWDTVARMRKEFPETKVIVLSMEGSEKYFSRAVRAGASGYLSKGAAVAELRRAIRAVMKGETYFRPHLSKEAMARSLARSDVDLAPLERLTPRQREVVQRIAEGSNTKQVASDLKVSVKTIEAHRTHLMHRLMIHDIPGLVRYAMRTGLVPVEVRRS